jgi:hypothetical protein
LASTSSRLSPQLFVSSSSAKHKLNTISKSTHTYVPTQMTITQYVERACCHSFVSDVELIAGDIIMRQTAPVWWRRRPFTGCGVYACARQRTLNIYSTCRSRRRVDQAQRY